MRIINEDITVGSSVQLNYKRAGQSLEGQFKEFIDNSSQSFFDNRETLKLMGVNKCTVTIRFLQDQIIITDNAFGMDHQSFKNALQFNAKPKQIKGSRNQFGMGLKYSAIQLGDEYTIESSAYGSTDNFKATIKAEELEIDAKTVENQITSVRKETHYTRITIRRLNRDIPIGELEELMVKLGKIYREDISNGDLEIIFEPGGTVEYNDPILAINQDGSEYLEYFDDKFIFRGKEFDIRGWIGILETGSTGLDSESGFSLMKDNRVILLNYKPQFILGKPNTFPSQRIVGNITVDDFPDNFNKGSFTWDDGLEAAFLTTLKNNKIVNEMIKSSEKIRKRKDNNLQIIDAKKLAQKTNKQFSALSKIDKTHLPIEVNYKNKPAYINNIIEDKEPIKFRYEGRDFTYYIFYSDNQTEWFNVHKADSDNSYIININNNFNIFDGLNKKSIEVIQQIIIVFVTAELSSFRIGNFNQEVIRKKINEIMSVIYNEK